MRIHVTEERCKDEERNTFAGSVVGVFELRAMLSHLDINWYLMIFNSIEINRLVCVTEATSKKYLAIIIVQCHPK